MNPRLWVLVGATGTGKTALSLALAEHLRATGRPAEIVNGDAMQLYRGMDIGTAKLPESQRRGIPHHLFDALEVTQDASVAWYQPAARRIIDDIHRRGSDAILVGGSGLYVSSVVFDFRFPGHDPALRADLEAERERTGAGALFARLRELDPDTAARIDPRNARRIVRAIEVAMQGETSHRGMLPDTPAPWRANTTLIGVHVERSALVPLLDRRVDEMWHNGLVDEVAALRERGLERGPTASRAIGYAQALAQLAGRLTQGAAIAETQALTRRYARRQVSWFKRYDALTWVPADSSPEALVATAGP